MVLPLKVQPETVLVPWPTRSAPPEAADVLASKVTPVNADGWLSATSTAPPMKPDPLRSVTFWSDIGSTGEVSEKRKMRAEAAPTIVTAEAALPTATPSVRSSWPAVSMIVWPAMAVNRIASPEGLPAGQASEPAFVLAAATASRSEQSPSVLSSSAFVVTPMVAARTGRARARTSSAGSSRGR